MQAALEVFYRIPFAVLEVPNIRLKKPGFVKVPSAMVVFSFILFSYFLVTGGIIYDVIVEPPSIGSVNGTRDVSLTHTHTHTSFVSFPQPVPTITNSSVVYAHTIILTVAHIHASYRVWRSD